MSQELTNFISGAVYGIDEPSGLVRVQSEGKTGLFTYLGQWRSGDRFDINPLMCNWVGGPRVDTKYDKPYKSF
jgi:hypothetical protein